MIYMLTRQHFVLSPYRHVEPHFLHFEKCFQSWWLQFTSCHSVWPLKKITVHLQLLKILHLTPNKKQFFPAALPNCNSNDSLLQKLSLNNRQPLRTSPIQSSEQLLHILLPLPTLSKQFCTANCNKHFHLLIFPLLPSHSLPQAGRGTLGARRTLWNTLRGKY